MSSENTNIDEKLATKDTLDADTENAEPDLATLQNISASSQLLAGRKLATVFVYVVDI